MLRIAPNMLSFWHTAHQTRGPKWTRGTSNDTSLNSPVSRGTDRRGNMAEDKNEPIRNSRLLDSKLNLFRVLDLVDVRLPSISQWWNGEDIIREESVGAQFNSVNVIDGELEPLLAIMVADSTQDPEEPDVRSFDEANLSEIDKALNRGLKALYKEWGMEITQPLKSEFVEYQGQKSLKTRHVQQEEGAENKTITIRM